MDSREAPLFVVGSGVASRHVIALFVVRVSEEEWGGDEVGALCQPLRIKFHTLSNPVLKQPPLTGSFNTGYLLIISSSDTDTGIRARHFCPADRRRRSRVRGNRVKIEYPAVNATNKVMIERIFHYTRNFPKIMALGVDASDGAIAACIRACFNDIYDSYHSYHTHLKIYRCQGRLAVARFVPFSLNWSSESGWRVERVRKAEQQYSPNVVTRISTAYLGQVSGGDGGGSGDGGGGEGEGYFLNRELVEGSTPVNLVSRMLAFFQFENTQNEGKKF
ncbi:hypothetical protein V1478_017337 [Vespula squamosa]|uniref:Uncharacterized protein n=1 Tax=Vespula squamosa TaxID=30214 RepID=A0ABD1ZXQ5_VESSQ